MPVNIGDELKDRGQLKSYFTRGARPTQQQFEALIQSQLNIREDGIYKTGASPLQIQAENGAGSPQRVMEFYKNFGDKTTLPTWVVQLNTSGASGLAIIKGGETMPVLFIDEESGSIGINTNTINPEFGLDVIGSSRFEKININTLNINAGSDRSINFTINDHGVQSSANIKYYRGIPVRRTSNRYLTGQTFDTSPNTVHSILEITNVNPAPKDLAGIGDCAIVLSASGPIVCATYFNGNSSDLRKKKDIEAIKYGLNEIKLLNPVSFNWRGLPSTQKSLGFIAQEVKPIISEAVYEDDDHETGIGWCISYNSLIPVLINAIKELDQKVEATQLQLQQLQAI